MSMLAERKRKQKWSLNPRGKDWAQDANKFGQKMLEKMGWQQGKGLGAREDGIREHVKISYKNDSKGMGYKESNDQWTEHETNFSALLESLTGSAEKPEELKLQSLEKKSESSRVRVHYRKFTRGKDLSRYSEKDLANILGKKSLKEPKKEDIKVVPVTSNIEKLEKESNFLVNAGSMRDYFRKKLPNFGKDNGYVVGSNGVLKKGDSDSETDIKPSFNCNDKQNSNIEESKQYIGFGFKSEVKESLKSSTFTSYISETSIEKKKKKRKVEETEESTPKKKSKNVGIPKKLQNEEGGLANPAFNPMCTPVKVERHIFTTIEETFSEDISELEENSQKTVETEVEIHELREVTNNNNPVKKKKKKKKDIDALDMSVIEICNGKDFLENSAREVSLGGSNVEINVTKDKKKKKKKGTLGVDNMNFEEALSESVDSYRCDKNSFEVANKKTQKEGKKKKDKLAVDNPTFNSSCEEPLEIMDISQICKNPFEVEIKANQKKKKKEKFAIENPTFNGLCEEKINETFSVEMEENPYEVTPVKKKKKKKEKLSVENPSFNGSEGSSGDFSLHEDNLYALEGRKEKEANEICSFSENVCQKDSGEAKKKKKKRKDMTVVENPAFNDSVEETPIKENPFEVKRKRKADLTLANPTSDSSTENLKAEESSYEVKRKKKKKESKNKAIENPAFSDTTTSMELTEIEENLFEVKSKEAFAVDNPHFDPTDHIEEKKKNNTFEVVRKRKPKKCKEESGVANPGLDLDSTASDIKENFTVSVEESDLMLNIVTTPILVRPKIDNNEDSFSITKVNNVRRRKSVRFSDVTQERIIPNNDDLRNLSEIENRNELFDINTQVLNSSLDDQARRETGLDNLAFDKQKNRIEENLDSISKTLDRYQAEIENDINEKKLGSFSMDDIMIGEVGNPHGENEKLEEGTKLKFKYVHYLGTKTPIYQQDKVGPKKGYRHLIKGDIVVKFNNTNLHQIGGYGLKKKRAVV